jgi:hypothetical protein
MWNGNQNSPNTIACKWKFRSCFCKSLWSLCEFFLWKMYAGFWSDFFLEELLRFITIFSCSDNDTFLKILWRIRGFHRQIFFASVQGDTCEEHCRDTSRQFDFFTEYHTFAVRHFFPSNF